MKIIWMTIFAMLLFACNDTKKPAETSNHDMAGMKMDTKEKNGMDSMKNMPGMDNDVYYTCSMHPQIRESKPGKCPICGMELIETKKNNATSTDEIKLSDQQVQLATIMTDTIRSGMLGDRVVLTATLNTDQMKTTSISARIMGRIEKLYYKNTGDYVKKGDKLYDLYSEELNNAKQELISTIERKNTLDNSIIDFNRLIESAKYKLLLWGLSDAQVEELIKTRKTSPITTFYSIGSGYITMLEIKEGDYTSEGGTLMRLADFSTLWAEAQIYSSQLSQIDRNGIAEVQIPDFPGKKITGKIEYVNPEINPDTRINLVRISIPNPGNQLQPGMPAYVFLKNQQHRMLSLPIDAVIRDGLGATVWIQTGKNTYKNRMVVVGMETGDRIEIKSGLKEGDVIVINGAYLINSEYIFKKGANPMGDMKM